jgi:hypothetical protein
MNTHPLRALLTTGIQLFVMMPLLFNARPEYATINAIAATFLYAHATFFILIGLFVPAHCAIKTESSTLAYFMSRQYRWSNWTIVLVSVVAAGALLQQNLNQYGVALLMFGVGQLLFANWTQKVDAASKDAMIDVLQGKGNARA